MSKTIGGRFTPICGGFTCSNLTTNAAAFFSNGLVSEKKHQSEIVGLVISFMVVFFLPNTLLVVFQL